MKKEDIDTLNHIAEKYGFAEWTLIGFNHKGEFTTFSYFNDPSIMPVFKFVLLSLLKKVEEYLGQCHPNDEQAVHHAGRC